MPKKQKRMVPVTYTFPEDLRDQITEQAERENPDKPSASDVARTILRKHFNRNKKVQVTDTGD
jgi:hypothetical protein